MIWHYTPYTILPVPTSVHGHASATGLSPWLVQKCCSAMSIRHWTWTFWTTIEDIPVSVMHWDLLTYLLTYFIKYRRYSLLGMQIKSDISTNKALKASKPSCTESANIKQNCVYLLQSLPGRRWRMSVSGRACPWSLCMPPGWTDDGMLAETPQDDHLDTTGCNQNLFWDTNCTHTAFRLPAAIYCPQLMSGQPLWCSYHHGPASTAYWQGACGQL